VVFAVSQLPVLANLSLEFLDKTAFFLLGNMEGALGNLFLDGFIAMDGAEKRSFQ
jgi:hypothetical protein